MADKKKAAGSDPVKDSKPAGKPAREKTAPPAEAAAPAPRTKSTKVPKLAKKNKSRLPRREKKARMKASAAQTPVRSKRDS